MSAMHDPIPVFVRRAGDTNYARCGKSTASSTSHTAFAAERAAAKALGCPESEVRLEPVGSALYYATIAGYCPTAKYQTASDIVGAESRRQNKECSQPATQ